RDASGTAGAGTPSKVPAGTGGQAAEAPVLPSALVGLGALLLGSAVVLRRRPPLRDRRMATLLRSRPFTSRQGRGARGPAPTEAIERGDGVVSPEGRPAVRWTAGVGIACVAAGVLLAVTPSGPADVGVVPAATEPSAAAAGGPVPRAAVPAAGPNVLAAPAVLVAATPGPA